MCRHDEAEKEVARTACGLIFNFKAVQMKGTITYYNNARGFVSSFVKGEAPPVLEGRVRFDIGPAIAVGKKAQALNVQYLHKAGEIVMAGVSL